MMDRRNMIGRLMIGSAGLLFASSAGAQSTEAAMPAMPGMATGPMTSKDCIESCWRSHVMCLETHRYLLDLNGGPSSAMRLTLLEDCAEICQTTANSMLRRSPQHAALCIACAQVCNACAKECETVKNDDRMMLCARTCRECADHCLAMSKLPI